MVMLRALTIAAALLVGLLASPTSAVAMPIFQDFRGSTSNGPALVFTDGTVTATDGGVGANVFQTSDDGLGVVNRQIDDNTPGGVEGDEFLIFTFNGPVSLDSVIFRESAGANDSFDLFIDGVDQDVIAILGSDRIQTLGVGGGEEFTVDFTAFGAGTVFAFTDGSGQVGGDDYSVAAIEFQQTPEPGSLGLLGLVILALMLARRRAA